MIHAPLLLMQPLSSVPAPNRHVAPSWCEYRLWQDDPAAVVLASYPDAVVNEKTAVHGVGNWGREWGRRFG